MTKATILPASALSLVSGFVASDGRLWTNFTYIDVSESLKLETLVFLKISNTLQAISLESPNYPTLRNETCTW